MKQTPLEIDYARGIHRAWEAALHSALVQREKEGNTLSGEERKKVVDAYVRQNVKHADAIVACKSCQLFLENGTDNSPLRQLLPEEVRAIGRQLGISLFVRKQI